MWRRACLGVHEDAVTLLLMWTAGVLDVLLLGADVRGWPWGVTAAVVVGSVTQAVFWWRRRRWDRFIWNQWIQGVAQAEVLLGRRVE